MILKNISAVRGSKQSVKSVDNNNNNNNSNLSVSIINDSPHFSLLSKSQLMKITQFKQQLEVKTLSEEKMKSRLDYIIKQEK